MLTHYQVLGVYPCSTYDEIRSAYRALALTEHPDVGGLGDRFKDVALAWSVLRNEATRSQYDTFLNMTHKKCAACGGTGVKTTTKNFNTIRTGDCEACKGAGYL